MDSERHHGDAITGVEGSRRVSAAEEYNSAEVAQ